MERTLNNCALIKINTDQGRGVPKTRNGLCEGYSRRGKVHKTCERCDLYVNFYKNIKKGRA